MQDSSISSTALPCPVCGTAESTPFLSFSSWPLMQHPVDQRAAVAQIYVDLHFVYCEHCAHVYQNEVNHAELEEVYKSYYYTPSPHGLRASVREDFVNLVTGLCENASGHPPSFLEIGCSGGEVLLDLRQRVPAASLAGFEPNAANREAARREGLMVFEEFATPEAVSRLNRTFDVVFARHVIEHIADFDTFLKSMEVATAPEGTIILETPLLDWTLDQASVAPFHVEHLHVFSRASLARLMAGRGWDVLSHKVTRQGNIVMAFGRDETGIASQIAPPRVLGTNRIRARLNRWARELEEARRFPRMLIWGAGPFGLSVCTHFGTLPDAFLDSNEAKAGLQFPGLDIPILHAGTEIARQVDEGLDPDMAVVIASTYYPDIERSLEELRFGGTIISLPRL